MEKLVLMYTLSHMTEYKYILIFFFLIIEKMRGVLLHLLSRRVTQTISTVASVFLTAVAPSAAHVAD